MKLRILVLLALCSTSLHAQTGASMWTAKCKSCHGADGRGATRMGVKEAIVDLSSRQWQRAQSDSEIREVIRDGSPRNSKMKPFKDKLTPAQIDLLVKHVRSFAR